MKNKQDRRINLRVPCYVYEWLKEKASSDSITVTELLNRIALKYKNECEALDEPRQY